MGGRIIFTYFTENTVKWGALALTWAAAVLGPHVTAAQQPDDSARQLFESQDFPWYDAKTGELADLGPSDASRADTLNRGDLPIHTSATSQPTAPNSFSLGFSQFVTTLIWIGIGAMFAIVVGVLLWMFLKMESNSTGEMTFVEKEKMQDRIKQLPFEVQQTTGNFRDMAEAAARQGNYSRAIMLLFSFVLLQLDTKGLIRLMKGKTNRQYLGELRKHPVLTQYYRRVMIPFEDTFFGDHSIESSVFENCWQDLDQFQAQLGEVFQEARL